MGSKTDPQTLEAQIHEILAQNLARAPRGSDAAGVVSLERGLIFPRQLVTASPLASEPVPPPGNVVDGAGHSRPIYAGLLVYAWLRAGAGRRWMVDQIMPWCEQLELNMNELSRGKLPAAVAWDALALCVGAKPLGRSEWTALAAQTFAKFADGQQADGALLAPLPVVNPETRWYDELVLLHAMCSYGVEVRDSEILSAVERAAEFNVKEMQPDHATQQPWALFAFHRKTHTRIQAEQILHTAIMHGRTNLDAVSLILLADALWCARSS